MLNNYTKDLNMTSREIVKKCIEFRNPLRIGLHFETDPIQGKIWNESDFVYSSYAADSRFIPAAGQKEWVFDALFKGTLKDGDPLGIYASAIDGVSSMIIGAAANQSAISGQPVAMKNILGAHAEQW